MNPEWKDFTYRAGRFASFRVSHSRAKQACHSEPAKRGEESPAGSRPHARGFSRGFLAALRRLGMTECSRRLWCYQGYKSLIASMNPEWKDFTYPIQAIRLVQNEAEPRNHACHSEPAKRDEESPAGSRPHTGGFSRDSSPRVAGSE